MLHHRKVTYMKTCRNAVSVLMLAVLSLSLFSFQSPEAETETVIQEENLTADQTAETSQEAQLTLTESLNELLRNDTIVYALFATVTVIVALFLGLYYRMSQTKRVISIQNKRLSAQQAELKFAKTQITKALRKEKEVRAKLEKTYENLKAAQSQLIHAEKMSSLGQLTAGIAHEINNPVGFIKGGLQTLKVVVDDVFSVVDQYERMAIDGQVGEQLAQLRAESREVIEESKDMAAQLFKDALFGTERVTEIVNGLRVFSRHDEARVKRSSISENLDAALMILKHKTKNKVEIIKQFDPNVGEIDCLPGQLNQVFINLISNAVDAFDNYGTLIISTHDLGDRVQLSFKDNGRGIPDEIMDKIFDPFFSTKEVGEGTGLGLSISHSIIEQHKGKIEVFSKVGLGTEFRITLFKKLHLEEEAAEESSLEFVKN